MTEEKRNHNCWLEDKEFLSKSLYPDKYYLESLCHRISAYLKNTPIHIKATIDNKHDRLFFCVGENCKYFYIDSSIVPHDFVTMLEKEMRKFYPVFDYTEEIMVELSDEEMREKIREGVDLNDVLLLRKPKYIHYKGCIEKIYLKEDSFLLKYEIDGVPHIERWSTVAMPNAKLVSVFMTEVRNLPESERFQYIRKYSKFVQTVEISEIPINYNGMQMINFFKINFDVLKDVPLEKCGNDFTFTWGRFKLFFSSETLRDDCLKLYERMKNI